ncbi:MAG: DNA polymerase IV [Chloroflexi bacterium]|nr:DNA polymerase IV [Chloroflexota bacterium]
MNDESFSAPDPATRCIAHCDADRFFFAVEAIERPALAEEARPVVVGHDPRQAPRAIVTTANDAARRLGIGSGLSGAIALRLAPDALFVSPRHELYQQYSARLMAVLREASPTVQQLSIDEAWLDWHAHGFAEIPARELRARVLNETGLSISVGVATSKLVAKMATEAAKPGGVQVVRPGDEAAFLAPQPIRALYGVGPRTAERLAEAGIETIGQIAAYPRERLVEVFGRSHGGDLWERAQGIDRSPLAPERDPKSYSAEHTFQRDTLDRRTLWHELRKQADEVAARLRADALCAREVAVKVRYASFETITRQLRMPVPTDAADDLADAAALLMRRHWDRGRAIRLIGLRASRFVTVDEPVQLPIPWPDEARRR